MMKKKISIPSPCSEDWTEMTPTEKGAFCDKCQIDVVDFTKKSPEQIRDMLSENAGAKLCGHISKTQMDLVNTNYHLWENQNSRTFRSKFLYACLMVFGMALFTGCEYFIGEPEQPVGEMEIHEVGTVVEDTSDVCTDVVDGMMEEEMLGEFEE